MNLRVVRQNQWRVARRIHRERHQLHVRHLANGVLNFVHLRSHARAWAGTSRINKIRYPDLPGENGAVERLSVLRDQVERRHVVVDGQ